MATKLTVQFNLAGGTLLKLGTERHHGPLLDGIDRLEDIGCFALTELSYGNNAVRMETTAVYDATKKEFIINTGNPGAQKYWITVRCQNLELLAFPISVNCRTLPIVRHLSICAIYV